MVKRISNVILILSVLFATLMFSTAVNAVGFSVVVNTVDNIILPNETASFNITVTNYDNAALRMQIFESDPEWTSKVTPQLLNIPANSEDSAVIKLSPNHDVSFGTKGILLYVRDLNSGIVYKQSLTIRLKNPDSDEGEYAPSVRVDVNVPQVIDPRKPFYMDVNMQNRNKLEMEDLKLVIHSEDLLYLEDYMYLGPAGELTRNYKFDVDKFTTPGSNSLIAELFYKNKSVNKVTKELMIDNITEIKETTTYDSFMFQKVTTVDLYNDGNVVSSKEVLLPTNLFKRIFTSKSDNPEVIKTQDGTFYSWNVELDPDTSYRVIRTENYRYLIIIILLGIIGVILYYVYRSPLIALKEIVALHSGEGSSELKVRIFVKNRTSKVQEGVTIIDAIPRIASYEKKHYLGSLAPTKVVNSEKKGTLLKWELDVLEPFEERILVYNIKSRLKIVGKVSLPNAKIKYLLKNGKEKTTLSNNTCVLEQ